MNWDQNLLKLKKKDNCIKFPYMTKEIFLVLFLENKCEARQDLMQIALNKKLYYMYFISAESVEMQRKLNDFKNFNDNIYHLIKFTLNV